VMDNFSIIEKACSRNGNGTSFPARFSRSSIQQDRKHRVTCRYRLILTRYVARHRPMTTRSRFVASIARARSLASAVPAFLFAGSDAYCKRFQALLSILLTLLPAIPQLHSMGRDSRKIHA